MLKNTKLKFIMLALFFCIGGTLTIPQAAHAESETPKAILCENGEMTFVYDANTYQAGEDYSTDKGKSEITNVYTVPVNSTGTASIPWYADAEDIESVNVMDNFEDCTLTSLNSFFKGLTNCSKMNGLRYIDTSSVTDMNSMFYGYAQNVSAVDITGMENWDVSNVTNLNDMFNSSNIGSVSLTKWQFTKSVSANNMFSNCGNLEMIVANNDWTASVTGTNMFSGCSKLVGGIDTAYDANHITQEYARPGTETVPGYFTGNTEVFFSQYDNEKLYTDKELTTVATFPSFTRAGYKLDGFYSEPEGGVKVLNQDGTFAATTVTSWIQNSKWCLTQDTRLFARWIFNRTGKALYCANGNLSFVFDDTEYTVGGTYSDVQGTTTILHVYNVPSDSTKNAPEWNSTTALAEGITSITITSAFHDFKPISTDNWFYGCTNINKYNNLGNINVSAVTTMLKMFGNTSTSVTSIDFGNLSSWDTSNVTNMHQMFYQAAPSATTWDITGINNWNTSKLQYLGQAFYGTGKAEILDLSGWDTTAVTMAKEVFKNSKVRELNISGWNNKGILSGSFTDVFTSCVYLQRITIGTGFEWKATYDSYRLPRPSNTYIPGADGYWHNEDTLEAFLKTEIPSNTAATYTAIPPYTPKAILGENGNLSFVFDDTTYTEGQSFADNLGTTTISKVYSVPRSQQNASSVPWANNNSITSVNFTPGFKKYEPRSIYCWFYGDKYVSSITNIKNINTKKVDSLTYGFMMYTGQFASSFVADLSEFDVGNLKSFSSMFSYVGGNATTVDLGDISEWDTSNVTGMSRTFDSIGGIELLDLSGWDTSKVTDMKYMFYGAKCKEINLAGFSTESLTVDSCRKDLFLFCSYLEKITFGDKFEWFGTGSDYRLPKPNYNYISDADGRWYNISTKEGFYPDDIPSNTAATYTAHPFLKAKAILGTNGNLSFFYDDKTYVAGDSYTDNLGSTTVAAAYDVPRSAPFYYNVPWNGTSANGYRPDITSANFDESFSDAVIGSMSYWFYDVRYIANITNADNINVNGVTVMTSMFSRAGQNASQLTIEGLSDWDVSNVTSMYYLFGNSGISGEIDLSSWNTENVTNMLSVFGGCKNITSLNLSSWSTKGITTATNASYMFSGCVRLKEITLGENFEWKGDTNEYRLPTPSNEYIPRADGKWYDKDTGVGYENTSVPGEKAATYTADPPVQEYTITFNSNGGAGTMSKQTFTEGEREELKENTFTKSGYIFEGWAETAGGDAVYTDKQTCEFTKDTTLYAVWTEPGNTVEFIGNGGKKTK